MTLSIPKATLSANSASTFKPYDPSRVIGDTNPALSALPIPQADDGCGGFGEILKLAVIIAVTILTEGATASWAAEAGFAEIGVEGATIASVDAAELAASVASGAVSYCPVHMTTSLAQCTQGRFLATIRRYASRFGHSSP